MRLGADPKVRVRYALVDKASHREGKLEFLCHCQEYWSKSREKTEQEKEDTIEEHMNSVEPPYTREEALEEVNPVVVKLTIEEL
jgi:hypothetical protein